MQEIAIFWYRRDLRLEDNCGLYHALKEQHNVLPIFIFDQNILEHLPKDDARVSFIHDQLQLIKTKLQQQYGSDLAVHYGDPKEIWKSLLNTYTIKAVYTNHDYEPYAIQRDQEIADVLSEQNITFKTYKDQVIFEKHEIVKGDGNPYVVYTPYKNKWKEHFSPALLHNYTIEEHHKNFIQNMNFEMMSLENMGFVPSKIKVPDYDVHPELIQNYEATRNFPAKEKGTSRLGPHLRFGTVSTRQMVAKAIAEENEVFWSELIWREFFMQILWHFPHTTNKAFKPKYDRIEWRNNEEEFEKWKNGTTGYPLVDAGMRELNTTGYMHNRVRMLVASFLCKHLLIDWRWGEAYFAEKLLDYDLSANVGNWQWAAGSGVDAAPYFRIFNPTTQITKFDKQHQYINRWVPDLNELTYPTPMVDHKMARERCLQTYKAAVG